MSRLTIIPGRGLTFRSLPRECVSRRSYLPGVASTFRRSPRGWVPAPTKGPRLGSTFHRPLGGCLPLPTQVPRMSSTFRSCPQGCVPRRSLLPTDVQLFVARPGNVCRRGLFSLQRLQLSSGLQGKLRAPRHQSSSQSTSLICSTLNFSFLNLTFLPPENALTVPGD